MPTILLHSSKTMRLPTASNGTFASDAVTSKPAQLMRYLASLNINQIQSSMQVSEKLAHNIYENLHSKSPRYTLPALDIFLGDIYSGLQVQGFTPEDRQYAHDHLFILSGLYGVLRALDQIRPYRLEMGYKLPGNAHDKTQLNITSLYDFWGDAIAQQLPKDELIVNLSAKEYTKAIFPHFKAINGLRDVQIISPKFLTVSPKTYKPTFVTVHAKIARGAFARWLVQHRIQNREAMEDFQEIGYRYDAKLSTFEEPVFVAEEFKGIGLSVRLT